MRIISQLKFVAVCLTLALSAAVVHAESMHIFGIHSWDWGADLDVMSWHTGWDVEAHLSSSGPDVGGRWAPACGEGFTIIQRLDWSWDCAEGTIPRNPADYPTFASQCANNWAANIKLYCRHYCIGNEMEICGPISASEYASCFQQVRNAIKAVQPEARVIIGAFCNSNNARSVMQTLGPNGFDGVAAHFNGVPQDLIQYLDEVGAPPDVGVYITEFGWVGGTNPNAMADMRRIYDEIGNWNATHTRQVYCACWYLYPSWLHPEFSLESHPLDNAAFEACTALGTARNSYSANPVIISDRRVEVSTANAELTVRWHTNLPSRTQLWYWKQGWNNGEFRPPASQPHLYYPLVVDHSVLMGDDPVHILPQTEYTIMTRSTADDCGDADASPIKVTTGPWTITTSDITGSTATISWQTLFASTSRVEYGTTTSYGSEAASGALVTNHVVNLTGLSPSMTYHYRVWSEASGYAAHHSADRIFTTTSNAQTPPGFYEAGWNLTSVPVQPFNTSPTSVFQDLISLGNVIEDNLYRWNSDLIAYVIYPSAGFSSIDRGRGYWLWLTTVGDQTVVSVAGQAATGDVLLSLSQGWNLIGHPHPQPVLLSACQVTNGATTESFDSAVAASWVAASLYYWEADAGYQVLNSAGYGGDDSLRPWRGYWIHALADGLQLIVPRPA